MEIDINYRQELKSDKMLIIKSSTYRDNRLPCFLERLQVNLDMRGFGQCDLRLTRSHLYRTSLLVCLKFRVVQCIIIIGLNHTKAVKIGKDFGLKMLVPLISENA